MWSNAAANVRALGSAPASWACALLVLAVHGLVTAAGGVSAAAVWFVWFGFERGAFLGGRIWQPLTHGLLHASWAHAGINALFLLLVGSRVEHMAGSRVMLRAVLSGILAGACGHLLLGADTLVGASGGCFALLLLLTTLSPQSRFLPLPWWSGRSLGVSVLMIELVLALLRPGLGVPGFAMIGRWLVDHGAASWFTIGHACHLGGGLAGWAWGRWVLRPRVSLAQLQRERARREGL